MKKIITSTLILVAITLVAGFALASVYEITKDPIAKAEQEAKENAYRMVMPNATSFISQSELFGDTEAFPIVKENGVIIEEVLYATRDLIGKPAESGEAITLPDGVDTLASTVEGMDDFTSLPIIGYVVNVTSPNGYGGDITIAVGILKDGTIKGISVISQSETAGLGAVCAEEKFTSQFAGIQGFVEYVKDGKTEQNQIDAISGATITTKAVTEAVNTAIEYVKGGND